MIASGLALAWLTPVRGGGLAVVAAAALALAIAAGPGVTALRTRYVIPRLGYARHTERTDLTALTALALALLCLGLAWLEAGGGISWGRLASAAVVVIGVGYLARESGLGRHYLVAMLVAASAVTLHALSLPPYRFLAALLLATALLLTLGGIAALRSLVVHHPALDLGPDDEG